MPVINFRKHLICSVSGGRSSAYMAILVNKFPKKYKYRTKQYVFANTGLESQETIDFLENLENFLQQPIVKLEFDVVDNKYTYNIIDHWSELNMKGEPFAKAINYQNRNKHTGMPHMKQPYCSGAMKKDIIRKYSKESLGTIKYAQAIGFRKEDMPRRITFAEIEERRPAYIFPLITHYIRPIGIPQLNAFWNKMPFKLNIPGHLGNCLLCWKKSDKVIDQVLKSGHPQVKNNIEFYQRQELLQGNTSFRQRRSITDMITQSENGTLLDPSNGDSCACGV